jgi:hypothetical protein
MSESPETFFSPIISDKIMKINPKRVLSHADVKSVQKSDEVQILHVTGDAAVSRIGLTLINFKHQNFPNIFFVVVEFNAGKFSENFWKVLAKKFSIEKLIFVQVLCLDEKVFSFHQKFENEGNFSEINFDGLNFKLGKDFQSLEEFLALINFQKISILDVNLCDILTNLNQQLKNAIKFECENLFKFYLLFLKNSIFEIVENIFENGNTKILSLYFTSFDVSEDLLKNPRKEKLLKSIVENNEEKVLKIILKNSQKFSEHVNFQHWKCFKKLSLNILTN